MGITFVYVTHDQGEALTMSDRLVVMNHGRIEQLGTPHELYERPATRFVAGFIGTSNILRGRVEREAGRFGVIRFGPGDRVLVPRGPEVRVGEEVEIAVRPEKIALVANGGPAPGDHCALSGRVREVVYLGTSTTYYVVVDGGAEFTVFRQNAASTGEAGREGQDVQLVWAPEHSYVLGR
jgi:spermidine/putrescine transport system ATP-binding protein